MWTRILLLLVLSSCPAASFADHRPVLLVLGDSLSTAYGLPTGTGWVDRLEGRLGEHGYPWRVVNASISGETASGGLARLPNALARHSPRIVIIELGGNDALRGAPIGSIESNLDEMIRVSRDSGAEVLLVGMRIPPNYGPDYADAFEHMYTDLADRHQVPLVPFLLDGVAITPGMMQADGIHPTENAQPILLDHVWRRLGPMLEASETDASSFHAPAPVAAARAGVPVSQSLGDGPFARPC